VTKIVFHHHDQANRGHYSSVVSRDSKSKKAVKNW